MASDAIANKRDLAEVLRAFVAQAQNDTGFGERFCVLFLQRRRDALGVNALKSASNVTLSIDTPVTFAISTPSAGPTVFPAWPPRGIDSAPGSHRCRRAGAPLR